MVKISKRKKGINETVDNKKLYGLKEAVTVLKNCPGVKFDQSVEVSIKLNLEQSSNPLRGTVSLPHGTGKKVRIAVFCKGDYAKQAKEAGADFVGDDDLLAKVSDGWMDFDVAVTTPDMMRDLAKLGKILGPRGLMPNPKSGTVTTEIGKAVKDLQAGKIEYRMDKQSEIKGSVGKLSFDVNLLTENVTVFINTVMSSNPKTQKIQNIKSIWLSSSMGPGLKLEKNQFKTG